MGEWKDSVLLTVHPEKQPVGWVMIANTNTGVEFGDVDGDKNGTLEDANLVLKMALGIVE